MAAVGLLLLVVCGNLAGLFLAKSAERNHEITVRLSLGASRWRLTRQLYAENLLLIIPGAVIGILFVFGMLPLLLRFMPTLGVGAYSPPTVLDVTPDLRVFAFASLASLLAFAVFGFAPVWRACRRDLHQHMAVGGRSVSAVSASGAVAFQIGLTVLLVTASLLIVKTFWKLNHSNPGFDQDHVIEAVIDPWDAGFSESQATNLLVNVRQSVTQLPGVRAVSFAMGELMRGIGAKTTVVPAGSNLPQGTFLNTSFNRITPDYFDSLGIPLMAGRNLDVRDVGMKPSHIVVNRAFADYFFPGQNPVGKAIVQGVDGTKPPTALIVGVVGTAKYRSMREVDPPIYYAVTDMAHAGGVIYVRTHGDPATVMRGVRGIVRELAPTLPLATIYTLRQEVEASLWQERLITLLCAFFACSALLLSGIGVYSALAYSVGHRLREFGIRMALGAQRADIVRAVSSRVAIAVQSGVVGGLVASSLLLRFIKSFLFQVDPLDVWSFTLATVILLFCCTAATVIPTRRAIQIEPAIALRQE
jgi:predicted permease